MSSVSQAALLTDLMHVSVDKDDMEPPPGLERKVIGVYYQIPVTWTYNPMKKTITGSKK